MNSLHLDGLDGTRPHHMLAALGVLALTDDLEPGTARLRWRRLHGAFAPVLEAPWTASEWAEALASRVRAMAAIRPDEGAADVRRKVADLKSVEKKRAESLKMLRKELAAEAAQLGLSAAQKRTHGEDRLRDAEAAIAEAQARRSEAEESLSASLGFGPAHLGEIIGVSVGVFRAHARHALAEDPMSARQLAALASDGCLDEKGRVVPTAFSFSNGNSGKSLLKDFRNLAAECTREHVERTVFAGDPIGDKVTALNWDPGDNRSFAHQWGDPGDSKFSPDVDLAVNALAFAGLGLLPCFPGRDGLEATAMVKRGRGRAFQWPLWSPALGVDVVRAMLASAAQPAFAVDDDALLARGILAVYASDRINPNGKRNFFAPAVRLHG